MIRRMVWAAVMLVAWSACAADKRVWIEPAPGLTHHAEMIRVPWGQVQPAATPLVLECEVHSSKLGLEPLLEIEVKDSAGAVVYKHRGLIAVGSDGGKCRLEWDMRDVPAGTYTAMLSVTRRPVFVMGQREYVIRKADPAQLLAEFEAVKAELGPLVQHVAKMPADGMAAPYARMRLAIARDFMGRVAEAVDKGDWPRVRHVVEYLRRAVSTVKIELTFGKSVPELWDAIPEPKLDTIEVRNGVFYADGRPVFLFGGWLGEEPHAEDVARLRDYGLNFAAFAAGPNETLASATADSDFAAALDPVFQRAADRNVSIMTSLAPRSVAAWMIQQWPDIVAGDAGTVDLVQPHTRHLIERHIRALVPYLAKQKALYGIALAANPSFRFTGEEVRQGFLDVVRSHYKDREEVNSAWKGIFGDLDEIVIGWDRSDPLAERYQNSPAYQWDWQRFHQQLGSEYLDGMRSLVRTLAPHTPLLVGFDDRAFEPKESEDGVDREALARVFDLSGCCATNTSADPFYALGYPQQTATYTLLRSFAPERPVVNLENHIFDGQQAGTPATFAYVHSLMWEAAMAGLNASALSASLPSLAPECVEAYATACLDVNRLGPIVAAFQQAPAEVGILWSMPSKIYSDGAPYLTSARFAYEGCSFAGYKVRFITEKQCLDGELAGIKVLVVPDTPAVADETFPVLKEYMQGTGVVIRTSASILYNQHGHSRRDIITMGRRTVLARGQNLPAEYLHAMDAVAAFGELPAIPRVISEYGYPIEGVKSRYVELDGQGYLYIVNLRKDAKECHLYGGGRTGRDLIRGSDVSFPMWLEPLEPMLVRVSKTAIEPPPRPNFRATWEKTKGEGRSTPNIRTQWERDK